MRGVILNYDARTAQGIISGEDGQRYTFAGTDVDGDIRRTKAGAKVDFNNHEGRASSIYVMSGVASEEKSKIVAALLAFFLGAIGVHKFYYGATTAGVIMLVVSIGGAIFLLIPTLIMSIIAFIEFIVLLVRSDDEFQELYVEGKRGWF
ncbi:TM2 domain-containing protein [Parasulfitobacter algicola]|uniref:TM2 domain-containing protein n=1 Tax=Parasulfitobacter algicola TaxID=2614809 RepID=A0ABX2IWA5_9RHOB|nr:TM2 domain-containing protein [Sulfitobacter algicola]NSX56600.1 TM2 domain-containing protein [Sulfitobacter algicola]